MSQFRKCSNCKEEKGLNEFHKSKQHPEGHHTRCKVCSILYTRKYYSEHKEKCLKKMAETYQSRDLSGICVLCGNNQKVFGKKCGYCQKKSEITRKKRRAGSRDKVFNKYGDICACCGENNKRFLTIDHIENNGAQHRKVIKGAYFYDWLVKNDFPIGYQTLCWNCNLGKYHNGGICPHREGK